MLASIRNDLFSGSALLWCQVSLRYLLQAMDKFGTSPWSTGVRALAYGGKLRFHLPCGEVLGAKTQQSNGRATAPEIAIHRRHLFRSGWQRSTRTRTPASQPHVLSTDSAPCNAMPPTDAVRPTDKNNIVLAIHARWLDEPRSSRKRIFRASASAPVLVRPPYWEPRSDAHDWTSGSNPAQTLRRARCFPVTRRGRLHDPHRNPG